MKKILWGISLIVVLGLGMWGCATNGDIEKMQAQDQSIEAKADQAIQEAQAAKAAANAAAARADAATARADAATARADEAMKQKQADAAMFRQSMHQ